MFYKAMKKANDAWRCDAWGIEAACRRISAVQERIARPVGARP